MAVVLLFLGTLAVADVMTPPRLPDVKPLTRSERLSLWHHALRAEQVRGLSDTEKWAECQRSLAILDSVSPGVSAWVRERHSCGHMWFEDETRPYYACWWVAPRVLIVNWSAFGDDEELACTLAHEFRHGRQTMLRNCQAAFPKLVGWDRTDLVEAEAYQFGDRVRRAIRGESCRY